MSRLRPLAKRIWRLFVDDGLAAILLLGWIAAIGILSRWMHLGPSAGPVLFAGIAAITFLSFAHGR